MNRRKTKTPEVCPVCDEDVPSGALACPECGADHNSGWREDATEQDALDLPDETFDYDTFVAEEFGSGSKRGGIEKVWWITALVILIVLTMIFFGVAHFL